MQRFGVGRSVGVVYMLFNQEESTVHKGSWLNQILCYDLGGSLEPWDGVEGLREASQRNSVELHASGEQGHHFKQDNSLGTVPRRE